MCWEDIEIGRDLASAPYVKTAPNNAPALVAEADVSRTRITFAVFGAVAAGILPRGTESQILAAFSVSGLVEPLVFTVEEYGKIVQDAWYAFGTAADVPVLITTSSLRLKK